MPPKKILTTAAKPTGARQPGKSKKSLKAAVVKRTAAPVHRIRQATAQSEDSSISKPIMETGRTSFGVKDVNTAKVVKLAPQSRKRKLVDDGDEADRPNVKKPKATSKYVAPVKKPGTAHKSAASRKVNTPLSKKSIAALIDPPTQVLDVYVFGEGSACELGLGAGLQKDVMNVKRPRLNHRLGAKSVGVVQVAVGGMHCAALTTDNKILTWGVNDQGALGRDTDEGPLTDMDAAEESDDDEESDSDGGVATAKAKAKDATQDSGLNASEAEPREVDVRHFPSDTKFALLVASDSTTFALTTTGLVYGWGTFRANDGILGFRHRGAKIQLTPSQIPELRNIIDLVAGTNHILALDTKGRVYAWGASEQNQLARRVVARTTTSALVPREFGLRHKNIVKIGCGDHNSYAVDSSGSVYAWGLNSFAQCGFQPQSDESDTVPTPTVIDGLRSFNVQQIVGGAHHALALTSDGKVLVWGSVGNKQGGLNLSTLPADSVFKDDYGKIRYLTKPTVVPGLDGSYIATGPDTCAVVTRDGKAYTWGFNANHQTGQGQDDDEIDIAQLVDNTAVRGKKIIFAGVGGQFGILGGIPEGE